MTLDQLRIFVAVAERRHVTKAADALNLSQSAVSSAIAALETQHDVRLFDRIGRGIDLTEEGAIFLDEARALLARAENAVLILDDLSKAPRGHLRIQASQTVASYWLPPKLVALKDRYPGIDVSLRIGNTAEASKAVTDGAADLGFIEGDLPPSDLKRRVVAYDELVLVMPRDHPAADLASFSEKDYRGFRWLLREPGSGTRSAAEQHFAGMGLSPNDIDIAMELPSNEALLAAVAASRCVTMMSYRTTSAAQGQGLTARRVTWADRPIRPFAVLTHPDRHRTRAVQVLLDLLHETDPDRV